jgi:hypothetical protein
MSPAAAFIRGWETIYLCQICVKSEDNFAMKLNSQLDFIFQD